MIAIFACALCFYAFATIASAIGNALGVPTFVIWLTYYVASEFVETRRWLHRPDWRRSRLAALIGRRFMRTRFSVDSEEKLRKLPWQCIFVCEPHGVACLHLVFGFAAHGGALTGNLADRTLVVANWMYKLVPLLRNLYSAFGVIDNSSASVDAALRDGYSLALSPSALAGKWVALCAEDDDYEGAPPVSIVRRQSLGCFAYAKRFGAAIVPVLSPDENHTHRRYLVRWQFAPIVIALGPWLVRPVLSRVEWRVGAPLTASRTTPVEEFANAAYRHLRELGGAGYSVRVSSAPATLLEAMGFAE